MSLHSIKQFLSKIKNLHLLDIFEMNISLYLFFASFFEPLAFEDALAAISSSLLAALRS